MEGNKEQLQAIRHREGPMMVLAGPGSGKTFVITRRIRYLIEECGVPPEQILVITFTRSSAGEMKERFDRLMEDTGQGVSFGTFHSIYFHILKHSYHYTNSNIITEKEKREYLREIIEARSAEEELYESYVPLLLNDFSYLKNYGLSVEEFHPAYVSEKQFQEIFRAYQKRMHQEQKLDFDDMVLLCHRMFQNQPELLASWQGVFRYILIDEFQDINRMQYEVIRMLAEPERNLFVVGDDDQSIYGFRGSDPSIMLHFPKDYEDCKQVLLKENYRCTEKIVKAAVQLIGHNRERFSKTLYSKKQGKKDILVTGCDSGEEEAEEMIRLIKSYQQYGALCDIAILFRTNMGASFLAQKLVQEKIPFLQKEKSGNLFEDPMALDILAVLHFAHGEKKRKHFLRFMNKPVRYLRRDMLPEWVELSELMRLPGLGEGRRKDLVKLSYDLEQVRKMMPYAAINYIRKGMGYDQWVVQNAREKHRDAKEALEVLDWLQSSAKGLASLEEWLEQIELYELQIKKSGQDTKEDAVSLVTMHGSKGLEYKVVLIPDVNEGNVPQKKAVTAKELEEERRVFYVAMTRAKEKLFLFYVRKTKENRLQPSRFLREIGLFF